MSPEDRPQDGDALSEDGAAGENRSTSDPQETRLLKLFAEGYKYRGPPSS